MAYSSTLKRRLHSRAFRAGVCMILASLTGSEAFADVGPSVKISMPPATTVPAVSGEEYSGAVDILAHQPGRIENIELTGEGWTFLDVRGDDDANVVAGQLVRVAFRALPADETKPLRVRADFDGRTARRSFRLSRAEFAKMGKPRRVGGLDAAGRRASFEPKLNKAATSNVAGQSIRLHGRIAYMRPTVMGGPQDMLVGADTLYFEIMDDDSPDPFDEAIYTGYTDFYGNFDVTVTWDDCDITGCDDPDIYLYFETDNGVVNVQDTDILETDYSWDTQERVIDDFTGNDVDFGTVLPADRGEDPAIHIHNSIMRAHRFVLTRDNGNSIEEVDVLWPEEESGSGAYYDNGDKEIHLAPSRTWREDTHTHEYGHHFIYTQAIGITPNYCNYICDCEPLACDEASGCGHCMWCPETDRDAWNEGWPNWFADVVTRSYPGDYAGYQPLYTRAQEFTTNTCSTSNGATMPNNSPLLTEGFAGALLRDIDDSTDEDQDNRDMNGDGNPDDTDGDGAPDCSTDVTALGVDEIFTIVKEYKPLTILEFITAFRDRYSDLDQDLWSTVRNVHPSFGFPIVPPRVTSQSEGCRSYVAGENLALVAQGNGRLLSYQWQRDGADLSNGGRISGVTTPTLHVDNLTADDAGSYNCKVSTCNQALTVHSIPVNVQVFAARGLGTFGGSWGRNDLGTLGRGNFDFVGPSNPSTIPAPMAELNDAVKIAGGHWSAFALRADGSVWGWGANSYAALARTDITSTPIPVPIVGVSDAVSVSAGTDFAAALKRDGTVWVWGANYFGQYGNGQVYGYDIAPRKVPDMDCVVSLATGAYHVAAVKSDGTVWTWGHGGEGATGHGVVGGWDPTPREVAGISNARAVSAGYYHTLVLLDDGTVMAFGRNLEGQMGDGTQGNYRPSPIVVPGLSGVRAVRGGAFHSLAILEDGTVRAWGSNGGALGTGNLDRQVTPVQPLDVGPVLDVAGGYYHTVFLRSDRSVWVTGWNVYGELGPRPNPEPLRPLPVAGVNNAIAVGAGFGTSLVLTNGIGPSVSQQPANRTVLVGQSTSFSVGTLGSPTITYQWSRNGIDLVNGDGVSGVNTATLTLNPVTQNMAGAYAVRVQNLFGFSGSQTATLTVACAAGDADCNGRIDAAEAVDFADCLAGPGLPRPPACEQGAFGGFDANNDNDVDLLDAAAFQNCFAGDQPIPPNCGG